MPSDPNNAFAPDDPRWWWQPSVAPPLPFSGGADGTNNARPGPPDWIPLLPSARSFVPPAPGEPPDPFAAYWSRVPADSLRQFAFMAPIFPDALMRSQFSPPAPSALAPPPVPTGGLFGDLPRYLAAAADPITTPFPNLFGGQTNPPPTDGPPASPPNTPALPSTDASFPQLQADPGINNQFLSYSAFGNPAGPGLDPLADVVGQSDPSIFDSSALGPSNLNLPPIARERSPSFAESGSLPNPVSADGNPFTRFLNALNPISPAYAEEDDEIPPAELEALLHLLNPELAKQLIEQNRFWENYRRELQEVRAGRASSPALARHLEVSGIERPTGYAAHHIAAGTAGAAQPARDVLKKFGIGINDAVNGVFLPANRATQVIAGKTYHSTLHTNAYFDAVNDALEGLTTKQQVIDKVQSIGRALEAGEFP